jgi:hypothetical protein
VDENSGGDNGRSGKVEEEEEEEDDFLGFLIRTIYCACDADSCTLLGKHSIPPRAQGIAAVQPSLAYSPSNLQHYACVSSPPNPKKKAKPCAHWHMHLHVFRLSHLSFLLKKKKK